MLGCSFIVSAPDVPGNLHHLTWLDTKLPNWYIATKLQKGRIHTFMAATKSAARSTEDTTLQVTTESGVVEDVERIPVSPTAGEQVDQSVVTRQREVRDRLRAMSEARQEAMRRQRADTIAKKALNTPSDLSTAIHLKFIPADHLFIEEGNKKYQRPLNEDRVLDIASNFEPGLFGALQVVDRGSGYYTIVDGQHRWEAFKLLKGDKAEVPCVVDTTVHNIATEASRFGGLNTRRAAPAYNALFQSRLISGDTSARAVADAIHRIGLNPASADTPVQTRGYVTAMATLERILRMGGEKALDTVLSIIHDAWLDNPDGYRSPLLEGTFNFYVRYFDTYDRNHLVKIMRQKNRQDLRNPMEILSDAQHHYAAVHSGQGTSGDQMPQSVAYVLYTLYNLNRRYGRPDELPSFQISSRVRSLTRGFVDRYRRAMGLPVRGQEITQALAHRQS